MWYSIKLWVLFAAVRMFFQLSWVYFLNFGCVVVWAVLMIIMSLWLSFLIKSSVDVMNRSIAHFRGIVNVMVVDFYMLKRFWLVCSRILNIHSLVPIVRMIWVAILNCRVLKRRKGLFFFMVIVLHSSTSFRINVAFMRIKQLSFSRCSIVRVVEFKNVARPFDDVNLLLRLLLNSLIQVSLRNPF